MALIDTLTPYTTSRLVAWGKEIAGGGESLGFSASNTIASLMGRTNNRTQRVNISDETLITELIIAEVYKEAPESAVVLRVCYCGHGKWMTERREKVERILRRKLTRRRFLAMHNAAFDMVRWYFAQMARMAA
jgi:hypothetical protein